MSGESQPVRGRFAPSPTGAIHLGNVWTALLAWLDIRQRGGTFVLRMEDLDPDRSRPHWASQMIDDLRWLGLDWDEGPDVGGPHAPYIQNRRRHLYADALATLEAEGRVYPCFCTRAEARAAASAPHSDQGQAQCPNQCWTLNQAARATHAAERPPCLRIRATTLPTPIEFGDRCRGRHTTDVAEAGDWVIRRADGIHAYQLAVVVDDGLMGITDVVRGSDLLASTAPQIALHRQLGFAPPQFAHVPLLVDRQGRRLSKRHAALAIAALRAKGTHPTAIIGRLAHWAGLLPAPTSVWPRDLIGTLDLARLPQHDVVVGEQWNM